MDSILFSGTWDYEYFEWKFNKGEKSGVRYVLIAFARSSDQNYVSCMFAMYNMDFKIAPHITVTEKSHSMFWGLWTWTTQDVEKVERCLGKNDIKNLKNFLRLKTLQGFQNKGMIDKINVVPSLDCITY